jgi:hypothetical protein
MHEALNEICIALNYDRFKAKIVEEVLIVEDSIKSSLANIFPAFLMLVIFGYLGFYFLSVILALIEVAVIFYTVKKIKGIESFNFIDLKNKKVKCEPNKFEVGFEEIEKIIVEKGTLIRGEDEIEIQNVYLRLKNMKNKNNKVLMISFHENGDLYNQSAKIQTAMKNIFNVPVWMANQEEN